MRVIIYRAETVLSRANRGEIIIRGTVLFEEILLIFHGYRRIMLFSSLVVARIVVVAMFFLSVYG